jgi:hypothetical protein
MNQSYLGLGLLLLLAAPACVSQRNDRVVQPHAPSTEGEAKAISFRAAAAAHLELSASLCQGRLAALVAELSRAVESARPRASARVRMQFTAR